MTELDDILAALVGSVVGARSAAVCGMDGLLVECHPQAADASDALSAAAAELTNVLASGAATFAWLDGGAVRELVLAGSDLTAYARLLDEQFFSLLLLDANADVDEARRCSEAAGARIRQVFA